MLQIRIDPLEHGDLAALVCLDDPGLQALVIEHLTQLHFGIHTAATPEEVLYRLHTRTYEVLVTGESFAQGNIESHAVLDIIGKLRLSDRRGIYVVVIGEQLQSNSSMEAFIYSVDLTLNTVDMADFKGIVGRGIVAQEEFSAAFKAISKALS